MRIAGDYDAPEYWEGPIFCLTLLMHSDPHAMLH